VEKPAAPSLQPTLAAIEPQVQRKRDNDRRRILEEELTREQESLEKVRESILQEQQNPQLIAAVRAMQQANEPSPSQMVEMRSNIEKASGRIRGLQATVAEHEKNIEALNKELGALKP
jgi:chromosome segregation ATPase